MPTRFMALLSMLLALLVLVFVTPEVVDSLAPEPVPRASYDLLADTHQVMPAAAVGIDDGQDWRLVYRPKLASNETGGTINAAVPHDPG